jgi:soluble lytic murein transglycosylase-like protein
MAAPVVIAPPPALAAAVRAGHWADVRSMVAPMPVLSPAVALVAARAARQGGAAAHALGLLKGAIGRAGDLDAALRLEAASVAAELGLDPMPFLEPLLGKRVPPAHRRAAFELLRDCWETLPPATMRQHRGRTLPKGLRAELDAALAVRAGDDALAVRVLRAADSSRAVARVASYLSGRVGISERDRLDVAKELLASGQWREAGNVLARTAAPGSLEARVTWEYLSGRAAYRMGDFAVARGWLDQALAHAAAPAQRFAVAVQRARIAEIAGDLQTALALWGVARAAQPGEPEGWDGVGRCLVALGRGAEAVAQLGQGRGEVVAVVGPRLTATLLARGQPAEARKVLSRLRRSSVSLRLLWAEVFRREGAADKVAGELAVLLADRGAGAWRELAGGLLPPPTGTVAPAAATARADTLARIAVTEGVGQAREALALALAADPQWAALLVGPPPLPASWQGPAADLVAVGLDREAARLYAGSFPAASPEQLAWSAATLAGWDNRPAALAAGEAAWARLGVPALLVPDALLARLFPAELTNGLPAAAAAEGVPAPWLFGILRQESRFDRRARSAAGAVGIAQIVPETLRRLGAEPGQSGDETMAVRLAARELTRLSEVFGCRLGVAAAAYNAGDPVVTAWLAALGEGVNEVTFALAVPYRETAGYVLAVTEGAALSRHLT